MHLNDNHGDENGGGDDRSGSYGDVDYHIDDEHGDGCSGGGDHDGGDRSE